MAADSVRLTSCLTSLTDCRHESYFLTAKWRIMHFLFVQLSFTTSFVIEFSASAAANALSKRELARSSFFILGFI